jgi:hypothetical protein
MFHINMFSLKKHERLDRTRLHHFNCFYEVVKLEFNIFIWYNILLFVNQFDNLNAKHLSNMIIFCIYLCGVLIEILATRNCVQWLHYIQWLRLCLQGSPHLQKTGRLDFLLRQHEGEVKAWQEDFLQLQRHASANKVLFLLIISKNCIWSVTLLISFIFNFKFLFCTCIIIVDLIYVDFRFYSFRI